MYKKRKYVNNHQWGDDMNFNNIKNNDKIKNLIFILLSIFIFASSYMITYFYNSRKIQQTNMKVTEKKGELVLAENMDVILQEEL